jgi:hypothetical protein
MTDYSAWFTGADIKAILQGLKVWPSDGDESPDGEDLQTLFQEQCDISADAVKSEFEERTGRKPFLVTRATLTHTATTPDGLLQLRIPAKTVVSVSVGGSTVDSTTYWTQPETASLTGAPIEFIQFSSNYYGGRVWTRPNQISIVADYGYSDTIPAAVWRAGTNMAALMAISSIQGEQDLGSISEDSFSAGYDLVGPIDDKTRMKLWPDQWERIIKIYTRVTC